MAIRKILILVCDQCGEQEATETYTIKDAKKAGQIAGWKTSGKMLCPYHNTIHREQQGLPPTGWGRR